MATNSQLYHQGCPAAETARQFPSGHQREEESEGRGEATPPQTQQTDQEVSASANEQQDAARTYAREYLAIARAGASI